MGEVVSLTESSLERGANTATLNGTALTFGHLNLRIDVWRTRQDSNLRAELLRLLAFQASAIDHSATRPLIVTAETA